MNINYKKGITILGICTFILLLPSIGMAAEFNASSANAAIDSAGESFISTLTKFLGYAIWVGLAGAALAYIFGGQQLGKNALIGTGIGIVFYLILIQSGF